MKTRIPRPLYDDEDQGGTSQEDSDGEQSQEELDGGQKEGIGDILKAVQSMGTQLEEQSKKQQSFEKLIGNWANEMGELRKNVGTVNDFLSKREDTNGEDEFDPYDKQQLLSLFQNIVKEQVSPLQESAVTRDALTELLGKAQLFTTVKNEFGLNDNEVSELDQESQETGKSLRELAYDKYGERKFKATKKDKLNKELAEELKNNDLPPPPPSRDEAVFQKAGIPTDRNGFNSKFNELVAKHGKIEGPKKFRELLSTAGKEK